MAKTVFERTEIKYVLSKTQYDALKVRISDKMSMDEYGRYTITNLYYDTDAYDLIRQSIDKPVYKEKLRLRSYGKAAPDTPVFLELKKKFDGVVYKRRAALPYSVSLDFLAGNLLPGDSQVLREIFCFIKRYAVSPKVYLYYDRVALRGTEDSELRITFDSNVRFRQMELRLDNGTWGTDLLAPGETLMEIKASGGMPLWLCKALSGLAIFPASFSKYGECYTRYILPDLITSQEVAAGA